LAIKGLAYDGLLNPSFEQDDRSASSRRTKTFGEQNFRFGSLADICAATDPIRFTPKSGHWGA